MTEAAWQENERLLQEARSQVLAATDSASHELFQFRVNPSAPSFPLAYRRLDRQTLKSLKARLG